jgi:hypothetical protein
MPSSSSRMVKCELPVDLSLTLWPFRRGFGDPTMRWRASPWGRPDAGPARALRRTPRASPSPDHGFRGPTLPVSGPRQPLQEIAKI